MHLNFEFKARTSRLDEAEKILQKLDPVFAGEDHQVDTYFHTRSGRLKLREGNIENALIQYEREDLADSKISRVVLYQHAPDPSLKEALTKALGVKVVVDKVRKIYFIGHVKFHFDKVEGLGEFIEVEAIDKEGNMAVEKLQEDCSRFASLLGVQTQDFVAASYSDLLMSQ